MVDREEAMRRLNYISSKCGYNILLGPHDISDILGVTELEAALLAKNGDIPSVNIFNSYRVDFDVMQEILESDTLYSEMANKLKSLIKFASGFKQNSVDLPNLFKPQLIRKNIEKLLWKSSKTYGHSFVYFISDGEYVKIGKANDIKDRLNSLQTANARKLRLLFAFTTKDSSKALELEAILHNRYNEFKAEGEWFKIAEYIDVELFKRVFIGCNLVTSVD